MLPNYLRKLIIPICRYTALLFIVFYLAPTYAADFNVPTGEEMLKNIAEQIPNLMRLVTALAYVMGIYFIFVGIVKLKHVGESRTMMSQEHHITEPLAYIIVGSLLLYLPTTVQIGTSTFWTEPNPVGYVMETDQWSSFLNNCMLVVQLFGTIALIRGLVMLSHLGGRGGHQGGFAKGIMHIIGGIFCINIYLFVQMVLVTLGIQS